MRVLLVEDNDGDADLVREGLREASGSEVDITRVVRIQPALELLGKERFDVALLDLSLPDAQGLDGLHLLHATVPDLPIVVLTSLIDPTADARALREGAQDYLQKGAVSGYEVVRAIRFARERQRYVSRTTLLAEVALALATTREPSTISAAFVRSILVRFADRCAMDGRTSFDAVVGGDAITLTAPGTSRLYASLAGAAPGSDRARLDALNDALVCSAIVIPFLIDGVESGALVLGRLERSAPYVREDLVLAEDLARSAVNALSRGAPLPSA